MICLLYTRIIKQLKINAMTLERVDNIIAAARTLSLSYKSHNEFADLPEDEIFKGMSVAVITLDLATEAKEVKLEFSPKATDEILTNLRLFDGNRDRKAFVFSGLAIWAVNE